MAKISRPVALVWSSLAEQILDGEPVGARGPLRDGRRGLGEGCRPPRAGPDRHAPAPLERDQSRPAPGERHLHGRPVQAEPIHQKTPVRRCEPGFNGTPNGSRTRVSAVRGQCPWPLDDGSRALKDGWLGRQGSNLDSSGPEPDVLPITPRPIEPQSSNETPQGVSSGRPQNAQPSGRGSTCARSAAKSGARETAVQFPPREPWTAAPP